MHDEQMAKNTDREIWRNINSPVGELMHIDKIREAIARGWRNSSADDLKFDPDLAEAIVEEIRKIDIEPNLGCATTFDLVNELDRRVRLAKGLNEDWAIAKRIVND